MHRPGIISKYLHHTDKTHHTTIVIQLIKTKFIIYFSQTIETKQFIHRSFLFNVAVTLLLPPQSLQIFRAQLNRRLNIHFFRRGAVWTFEHLHSIYCMILERWLSCDPTWEAVVRVMMITQQCQLSGPSTWWCVIQTLRQLSAFFLGRWSFTGEVWEAWSARISSQYLWRGCERASADWRI